MQRETNRHLCEEPMKVFCFDLLPYGEELDHLKEAGSKELP